MDGSDQCPETPKGDRVGPYGCSCDVTVHVNFPSDSAELTPEAKAEEKPKTETKQFPAGSYVIWAILSLAALTGVTGYATYNEIGGDVLEEFHEVLANAWLILVGSVFLVWMASSGAFAFLTITLQSDQVVSGLALTFLGTGISLVLGEGLSKAGTIALLPVFTILSMARI